MTILLLLFIFLFFLVEKVESDSKKNQVCPMCLIPQVPFILFLDKKSLGYLFSNCESWCWRIKWYPRLYVLILNVTDLL